MKYEGMERERERERERDSATLRPGEGHFTINNAYYYSYTIIM
jgi:hypothetical protein